MKKEKVDVAIIGAGPSGAVSASYLCQYGIKVKVIEKSKFPRYSIGESLIPRCMDNFEEAGLLDCLKAQNYQVKTGARFIKDGLESNFDFSKKFGEGWDWTWQVPRDHFDHVLAKECMRKGVDIEFESQVTDVCFTEENATLSIENKNKETYLLEAKFVIDSSGFARVLAKLLNLEAAPRIPQHSSIFAQVKDVRRPEGFEGKRITFDIIEQEVWFWYIPFSNGNTSIGFVATNDWLPQFKGTPAQIFTEMLSLTEKYYPQFKELPFLFEPKIVKNIAKNVTQLYGNRFVLTGNSAEFLDPVFSSGVSFATESGLLAAKLILKELKGEKVDWQKEYVAYMQEGVAVFSTYVKEWYNGNLQKIIMSQNQNLKIKEQVCAVLAGYVWNKENPFVKKHNRLVKNIAHLIDMEDNFKKNNL
ncbi:NAD(P)/FAD-dependent oxidoreductase [Mesonia ostreae]|uniref:NAD(P)/FAD-dependent oxidoreductase n=1 Tax=Mesonia ostreae TaxID=861110 RepID=A0ABU2KI50_9FLAO|nr:NAD(P)/FAD-dependent oxidoreductase [Mesonia ostreae]MDT0294390.1 NAD(P)/FAD-dependent oxidoreductase [Mesonia ostreae]